jgi:hypothetical protein
LGRRRILSVLERGHAHRRIDLDRVGAAGVVAAYAEMALLRAHSVLCAAHMMMLYDGARGSRQKFALKILAEIPVSSLSVFY